MAHLLHRVQNTVIDLGLPHWSENTNQKEPKDKKSDFFFFFFPKKVYKNSFPKVACS